MRSFTFLIFLRTLRSTRRLSRVSKTRSPNSRKADEQNLALPLPPLLRHRQPSSKKEVMHPRAPFPHFRRSRLKPSVQNPQFRRYTRITAAGIQANGDAEIGTGGARDRTHLPV